MAILIKQKTHQTKHWTAAIIKYFLKIKTCCDSLSESVHLLEASAWTDSLKGIIRESELLIYCNDNY